MDRGRNDMSRMPKKLDSNERRQRVFEKNRRKRARLMLKAEAEEKENAEKEKKIKNFFKAEEWRKKIIVTSSVILGVFFFSLIAVYFFSKNPAKNILVLGFSAPFVLFVRSYFEDILEGFSIHSYKSSLTFAILNNVIAVFTISVMNLLCF